MPGRDAEETEMAVEGRLGEADMATDRIMVGEAVEALTDRGVGEAEMGPPGITGLFTTGAGVETGLLVTVVHGAPGTGYRANRVMNTRQEGECEGGMNNSL